MATVEEKTEPFGRLLERARRQAGISTKIEAATMLGMQVSNYYRLTGTEGQASGIGVRWEFVRRAVKILDMDLSILFGDEAVERSYRAMVARREPGKGRKCQ